MISRRWLEGKEKKDRLALMTNPIERVKMIREKKRSFECKACSFTEMNREINDVFLMTAVWPEEI